MLRCGSRSEYEVAWHAMCGAAHRAQREIDRRGACLRFGAHEAEEWLLFLVRHPDVAEESARVEAEELLVGRFGWALWNELSAMTSWRLLPDLHQDAVVLLLDRLRNGADDICSLRRPGTREVALRAAWWDRAATALDEGQGR